MILYGYQSSRVRFPRLSPCTDRLWARWPRQTITLWVQLQVSFHTYFRGKKTTFSKAEPCCKSTANSSMWHRLEKIWRSCVVQHRMILDNRWWRRCICDHNGAFIYPNIIQDTSFMSQHILLYYQVEDCRTNKKYLCAGLTGQWKYPHLSYISELEGHQINQKD